MGLASLFAQTQRHLPVVNMSNPEKITNCLVHGEAMGQKVRMRMKGAITNERNNK